MTIKPTALVILDGFGWREQREYNAVAQAKKPMFDYLWQHYPHALLAASGTAVGLPAGTIGNSEVGHMTLGAGRVIEQPITIINNAIADGSFFNNEKLVKNFLLLHENGATLHLIGLLSDGNVHSNYEHLFAYIKAGLAAGIKKIVVHAILDGRDVSPRSAQEYLEKLDAQIAPHHQVILGSIIGRFYAMDRDNNWERTAAAYECLVDQEPLQFTRWQDALAYFYEHAVSDEFIPPTQLVDSAVVKAHDGILFFNVRPDRARQLIDSFIEPDFEHFSTADLELSFFITPVALGDWSGATVLFKMPEIKNTLKEILSKHHKTIFSIAETEKYAHVTYFFSGLKEGAYPGETQTIIPSLKLKNYVEHPCMSAPEITAKILASLRQKPADFYLVNYANADMVGHSGDLPATIAAVECLDEQIKQLYDEIVLKMGGTLYITADHGNAELKYDVKEKQPHTAHTTSPVPFLYVDERVKDRKMEFGLKGLADVAGFVLRQMDIF